MTIQTKPIQAMERYTLGGAQFFGGDAHYSVQADPGRLSEAPIELHVGIKGMRFMLDMSIDEAEALSSCLAEAIRLRRAAEEHAPAQAKKAEAMEGRRVRTFFADPDGALETA